MMLNSENTKIKCFQMSHYLQKQHFEASQQKFPKKKKMPQQDCLSMQLNISQIEDNFSN